MSILDRYIARQYVFNVVALLVLLFAFIVAVDVTLNIDRFGKRATILLTQGGAGEVSSLRHASMTAILVFNLWGPRLLQLFVYTVGLAMVGAMGFTLTQMVRHRELVALLASGVSLRRVAWPMLVVAALLMGLKLVDHEFILSHPRIAPLLVRDHGDAGNPTLSQFVVPPTAEGKAIGGAAVAGGTDTRGRIFMASKYDPDGLVMYDVNIWERDVLGVAQRHIHAPEAHWREVGGVGGWDLKSPTVQSLKLAPAGSSSAVVDPGPAPVRIETELGPRELVFRRYAAMSQSLSFRQIQEMLSNPYIEQGLREKLERIRWGRISTIVSGLLVLIITMPFFLLREPRNMLVQSLKAAPVGVIALLGSVIVATMPVPGLPAWLSALLPVVILTPLAIGSVGAVRT